MNRERTTILVEIALSIALAAVLNTLTVFRMPQGGSVSLVMLPIVVLAIRRGPVAGLITGALYGCVDLAMNPYVVHPVQLLLDYPLAYAGVGLAGFWSPLWTRKMRSGRLLSATSLVLAPAVAVGSAARYLMHVVSGVIFFSAYAPPGQPVLAYSLIYNSYVVISGAAAFATAAIVLPAIERVLPVGRDAPTEP
jgi:thiamine transporter